VNVKSVGLRDLKNRLSEYVREVRSGEAVLVTDRGEVVAELIPPGQGADERRAIGAGGTCKARPVDVRCFKQRGGVPKALAAPEGKSRC